MAPLALAAVSALPILSYLDAKYLIGSDCKIISAFLYTRIRVLLLERRDRLNPFYLLENAATSAADSARPFLIYQGQQWTYKEGYDLVLRYAAWLRERHNVKRGDIVALDFMNKPVFLWMWFGLWALGARPALLNFNLSGDRLVHCVKIATTRLVIVDVEVKGVLEGEEGAETRRKLETEDGNREVLIFDDATERVVATWNGVRPSDEERAGVKMPDMAMLIYTSGTTGKPKAAVISYNKCHAGAAFSSTWLDMKKTDRLYTCMPLYHGSAAFLGLLSVLTKTSTLVLGHNFSTKTFWKEVRDSNATIIQYVGETCRYLLAAPPHPDDKLNNVRVALGNGLRPDVWARFKERFNIPTIAEFYASTEGHSGSWNNQTGEWGVGAIGRNGVLLDLFLGSGVRIAKMDEASEDLIRDPTTGFCKECAYDEPGEVLWRLDPQDVNRNFQGYFNNPSANASKVIRNVFKTGDAWFRTGDLQKRSRDGLWYFVDRIGDTFRWKSENVSTAEVAQVVGTHPSILETNVYGVELPNHDGRCGCAAITLAKDADEASTMRELALLVLSSLPKFSRPVFVRIVKAAGGMEKTGNHKFVKNVLRDEGVDPEKVTPGDDVWWLHDGEYRRFGKRDWRGLVGGEFKL